MTRAEREQFLADAHVAVLAVEQPDGPPLISPVWYGYEPGGDVRISTSDETAKAGLLRAAGRASLCAQRESLPYAYVTVEGPVVFGDITQEERLQLAVRYLGDAWGAEAFASLYPSVPIHPERVLVIAGAREELVSSGASTTWHDLVLYLIARYAGANVAQHVAHRLWRR